MAIGYDVVCVEDQGSRARHVWTVPRPIGTTYLPVGTSIGGEHVYCAFPGKDGKGAFLRVSLPDGTFDEQADVLKEQWAVTAPAAVRGQTAFFGRQAFGLTAYRFGEDAFGPWRSFSDDPATFTPTISAPALTRDHCVFATLYGQLVVVPLQARGRGLDSLGAGVFRFQTPHGRPISSAPAIAHGRVHFGCDDGYLYVLGSGPGIDAKKQPLALHQRRSHVTPAGARRYDWPSAFGGPRNANFVEDAGLKPPLRLRWAMRSGGLFKQPVCATDEDLIYVSLGGLVVCREQLTGRIRWRRKLPKQAWCRSAPLCADGKVFVPRMFSSRYPKVHAQANALYCLDQETGEVLWERSIGIGDRLRASPVYADGVVAYGSLYQQGDPPTFRRGAEAIDQAVDAWDADTGEHLWQVNVNSTGKLLNGPAGCVGGGVMFFTGGGEDPQGTGETVAIEPRTGRILWRNPQAFASQTGTPSFQAGKVYLPGTYKRPLACLSADDGQVIWQQDEGLRHWYVDAVSLGPDYFSVNNKYEGGAKRWNLNDGTLAGSPDQRIQLWGRAHGCGSLVLGSVGGGMSATNGGLYLTDVQTGAVLWSTPGFASFTCPHAIAANGRVFYCPQTSGMMFCFEPDRAATD
jgi:outer membrane protein assembly factor BamB